MHCGCETFKQCHNRNKAKQTFHDFSLCLCRLKFMETKIIFKYLATFCIDYVKLICTIIMAARLKAAILCLIFVMGTIFSDLTVVGQ